MKIRLDRLLVERHLAESREKAQALIMAGEVLLNGQKAAKPGQTVAEDAVLEVLARPPYVSRGGLKLAAALRHFAIDIAGEVCIDIGSSTGGFTDALLQAGAARVHAVDCGAGRLPNAEHKSCDALALATSARLSDRQARSRPTVFHAT